MSQSSRYNVLVLLRRVYTRAITKGSAILARMQTGIKYVPALLEYGGMTIVVVIMR
jgi:hypothetical protein